METRMDKKAKENIEKSMPKDDELYLLSELFKSFSDQTRLKIMHALSQGEMCVIEIAELVGMSQSAVSHQLRVLRAIRLVKFRKEGKTVYYELDDDHVKKIYQQGMEHIAHTK